MRGRAHTRAAQDLIVVSHDLFFEDVLNRDRLPPGRLPVLPPFSAVIFDEGHRVATEAQRAAGSRLRVAELRQAIEGCEGQGVRVRLLRLAETARAATGEFATQLAVARLGAGPDGRAAVTRSPALLASAERLDRVFAHLQDEMTIEEGLHEETAYADRLAILHHRFDDARACLRGLGVPGQIPFCEGEDFWVVPRDLGPLWQRHLPAGLPLVFSSATLSAGGSFVYSADALGLDRPLTARVGVPFRLATQMLCYLPTDIPGPDDPEFWARSARRIADLLRRTRGRALLLVPDADALAQLRAHLRTEFRVLWEGDAGPEALLDAFTRDRAACLAGHSFWEGIDVPGETLSAVIIPRLPIPGPDPLMDARRDMVRAQGRDPFTEVDLPAMALRLKQGVGRLIRTETDRGVVSILQHLDAPLQAPVADALPQDARRVRTLAPVARFFGQTPVRERRAGGASRKT
jgi:ATP-dependent DNA helicase DinG